MNRIIEIRQFLKIFLIIYGAPFALGLLISMMRTHGGSVNAARRIGGALSVIPQAWAAPPAFLFNVSPFYGLKGILFGGAFYLAASLVISFFLQENKAKVFTARRVAFLIILPALAIGALSYFANGYNLFGRSGVDVRYDKSGNKMWEKPYLRGELHGKVVFWWKNGTVLRELEYVHGERHGTSHTYTKDGERRSRMSWSHDRPTEEISFRDKGSRTFKGRYKDGKPWDGQFLRAEASGMKVLSYDKGSLAGKESIE